MTPEERDAYCVAEMAKVNPDWMYDHHQQYSSKFGIYFFADLPGATGYVLTAEFAPIGPNKDWKTNDDQFKTLVAAVLATKGGGSK